MTFRTGVVVVFIYPILIPRPCIKNNVSVLITVKYKKINDHISYDLTSSSKYIWVMEKSGNE